MGVRGRRVALIEEMSKTIISFQKAEPTMRLRTLAITGPTAESILYARQLIEETIKRNISPNRVCRHFISAACNTKPNASFQFDPNADTPLGLFGLRMAGSGFGGGGGSMSGAASTVGGDDADEDDDEMAGISIQAAQDGTLKVSCDDPEMLAVRRQKNDFDTHFEFVGSAASANRIFDAATKSNERRGARRAQGASQIDAASVEHEGRRREYYERRVVDDAKKRDRLERHAKIRVE